MSDVNQILHRFFEEWCRCDRQVFRRLPSPFRLKFVSIPIPIPNAIAISNFVVERKIERICCCQYWRAKLNGFSGTN